MNAHSKHILAHFNMFCDLSRNLMSKMLVAIFQYPLQPNFYEGFLSTTLSIDRNNLIKANLLCKYLFLVLISIMDSLRLVENAIL